MSTPQEPPETRLVGHRLREAREKQGFSLTDVERQTRIPRQYLQALEADQFGILPAPVYARGFLRNYARFLGLDENELLMGITLGDPQPSVLPIVPPRHNSGLWAVAGVAFVGGLLLWASLALGIFQAAGDLIADIGGDSPAPTPVIVTTTPVPSCDVLGQSATLTDAQRQYFEQNCATPTPEPPTPVPYRTDCDAIRGTDYQSPDERTYFLENCLTPPPG
jgi:transcriptional regulator with XRE-family HTH domain